MSEEHERCCDCGGTVPWFLIKINELVDGTIPDKKDEDGRYVRALASNLIFSILKTFMKTYESDEPCEHKK